MPLDVLGRTRATLIRAPSLQPASKGVGNLRNRIVLGIDGCNFPS